MDLRTAFLFTLLIAAFATRAQQKDTVTLDASSIQSAQLKPGKYEYLVYFKNGPDSSRIRYQYWTRNVSHTTYDGKEAFRIEQVWEDNDSIIHTVNSYCDRRNFQTFKQESWWKGFGRFDFDFIKRQALVNNQPLLESDTAQQRKRIFGAFQTSLSEYFLNWHLDLEVFSMLPFREGRTYRIHFYDPGQAAPRDQYYSITGSGVIKGWEGQTVDCWLLKHDTPNSKETFWISKTSHEVLKLEQQFGNRYRYKIRMPAN